MHQLLYVSHASRPLSEEELMQILRQSRLNNQARQITGLLVYYDGSFLQLLEGNKQEIETLFDVIGADLRHSQVNVIGTQEVDKRSFPDWSMGFHKLDPDTFSDEDGFTSIMEAMKITAQPDESVDASKLVEVMSRLIHLNASI